MGPEEESPKKYLKTHNKQNWEGEAFFVGNIIKKLIVEDSLPQTRATNNTASTPQLKAMRPIKPSGSHKPHRKGGRLKVFEAKS